MSVLHLSIIANDLLNVQRAISRVIPCKFMIPRDDPILSGRLGVTYQFVRYYELMILGQINLIKKQG